MEDEKRQTKDEQKRAHIRAARAVKAESDGDLTIVICLIRPKRRKTRGAAHEQ